MNLRYYPELRKAIVEFFDKDEFRELTYDLSINYDSLAGVTINGKAQKLVDYCEKRGRMEELLSALTEARPTVNWPEKAQPKKTKVSTALVQAVQKPEFKNLAQELSKDCSNMENKSEEEKNGSLNLTRCFENWETVHFNLVYVRQDLNTSLIEDAGTLKESRQLLRILMQYCENLSGLLEREMTDPPGIRPNTYLGFDLKKISYISNEMYVALHDLEGNIYAHVSDEEKIELVRQDMITLESMVFDIVIWFKAVIGLLDSDIDSSQTEIADNL